MIVARIAALVLLRLLAPEPSGAQQVDDDSTVERELMLDAPPGEVEFMDGDRAPVEFVMRQASAPGQNAFLPVGPRLRRFDFMGVSHRLPPLLTARSAPASADVLLPPSHGDPREELLPSNQPAQAGAEQLLPSHAMVRAAAEELLPAQSEAADDATIFLPAQ